MRADMQKVLVERPRHGSRMRAKLYRRKPRRPGDDFDGYPKQLGMGSKGYRSHKELSDNLSPLYRYLDKQVGRPWDKVYSEIAAHLDFRSVLGFHVKSHLDDYVEQHVVMVGKVPYRATRGIYWRDRVHHLYVHPRTGLLRRA